MDFTNVCTQSCAVDIPENNRVIKILNGLK